MNACVDESVKMRVSERVRVKVSMNINMRISESNKVSISMRVSLRVRESQDEDRIEHENEHQRDLK